MQISTKLFNQQQIKQFAQLTASIQESQEKIASGRAILRASEDPIAAIGLAAAKEQKLLLDRFERNGHTAMTRLENSDKIVQEVVTILTRMTELATQARNPAYDGFSRKAILTEVMALRETVLDLANSRDGLGHNLFSGFKTKAAAFIETGDGHIAYNGDRGTHMVQISEHVHVPTGIDGESLFGRVKTAHGRENLFDIIDGIIDTIDPLRDLNERASAPGKAELSFQLPRQNQDWSLELSGSLGSATIAVVLAEGAEANFIEAVNAQTGSTGISASWDEGRAKLILTDQEAGEITIKNLLIETIDGGGRRAQNAADYSLTVTSIDAYNQPIGKDRVLTNIEQLLGRGIENLKASIDHMSIQQAVIGAQMSKLDRQQGEIESRKLSVTKNMSRLGDADLAQLVTQLQAQLTNREAAQHAFAKIGQQSLFDFLR